MNGTAPYTYLWNDPGVTTDSVVTGLCAGLVSVRVIDNIGCARIANVTISEPNELEVNPQFINPSCYGDSNGSAWVEVIGGTLPIQHSWNTFSADDTIYNIPAGL